MVKVSLQRFLYGISIYIRDSRKEGRIYILQYMYEGK